MEDKEVNIHVYKSNAGDFTSYSIANSKLRDVLTSSAAGRYLAKEIVDKLAASAVEYYWENHKHEILKLIEPAQLQETFVKKLIEKLLEK